MSYPLQSPFSYDGFALLDSSSFSQSYFALFVASRSLRFSNNCIYNAHIYFRYRVEHTGRIQSRDDHWNKLSVYRHRFNSGATLFEKSDICRPLDFVGFFLRWGLT